MIHWNFCYKCNMATPDFDMVPYDEFNPDAGRTMHYLACPCGEREDITDAFECDKCEGHFPETQFETGGDLCIDCAATKFGVH